MSVSEISDVKEITRSPPNLVYQPIRKPYRLHLLKCFLHFIVSFPNNEQFIHACPDPRMLAARMRRCPICICSLYVLSAIAYLQVTLRFLFRPMRLSKTPIYSSLYHMNSSFVFNISTDYNKEYNHILNLSVRGRSVSSIAFIA